MIRAFLLGALRAPSARTATLTLACAVVTCAVASCADSTEAVGGPPQPITVPEAGPPADLDGGAPDGACDAASCAERELTCAEADLCTSPTDIDPRYALLGVWGSAAHDVWAVGSAGTVVHWDGAAWTKVLLGRKDTLHAVWGSSASDVWIVSSMNVVLRGTGFQGGTATFTTEPGVDPNNPTNFVGAIVTSVWGAGPDAVFVGGPSTQTSPVNSLWRRSSAGWDPASTYCAGPCDSVGGIWGTSDSDLWIASPGGKVLRSKGPVGDGGGPEQWATMKTTLTTADLHGIWGSSASDVWIVGDKGTIRHWSNDASQRWEIVASETTEDLRAVWGTGPSDVWAVGDGGTILHFDGTAWRPMSATLPVGPKPRLYGVWGSGPDDVWVVGEAIVLHFTGTKGGVK